MRTSSRLPPNLYPTVLHPDRKTLHVAVLFCVAATILFSLRPALKATKSDLVNDLKQQAGEPARVGSFKPNEFGLFDMLGNAWEWCHDELAPYPPGPAEDREQPGAVIAARERVLRGGDFFSAAPDLRSAYRFGSPPQGSFNRAGFRVARTWH